MDHRRPYDSSESFEMANTRFGSWDGIYATEYMNTLTDYTTMYRISYTRIWPIAHLLWLLIPYRDFRPFLTSLIFNTYFRSPGTLKLRKMEGGSRRVACETWNSNAIIMLWITGNWKFIVKRSNANSSINLMSFLCPNITLRNEFNLSFNPNLPPIKFKSGLPQFSVQNLLIINSVF